MYLDRAEQCVLAIIQGIQGSRMAKSLEEKNNVIIEVEIATKQAFALKVSEVIWRISSTLTSGD